MWRYVANRLPFGWPKPSARHACIRALAPGSRLFSSQVQHFPELPDKIKETLPPIARRMMEEQVLQRCDPASQSEDRRSVLQSYLEKSRTAEERHEIVVSFSLLMARYRLAQSSCPECLFAKERCICDSVVPVVPKNKLWLFQHVGEFGRANNTGSLLSLVAGAQRTIRGIRHQQDEMMKHIEQHSNSTVILFPNRNSITLDEYRRDKVYTMGSNAEDALTLILLDGTSRQAKNFDGFMPASIPRVRIREMKVRSWLDPIRRQTEEHRVCTAQAAAMILDELGDHGTSLAIEDAVRKVVDLARNSTPKHLEQRKETSDISQPFHSSCHGTSKLVS